MKIEVGDKVRVSKDTPKIITGPIFSAHLYSDMEAIAVVDDYVYVKPLNKDRDWACFRYSIPLKYLIKVEDKAKEPKFKKGDKVLYQGVQHIVEDMFDIDGWKYLISRGCDGIITGAAERFIDPYTEPKGQTEAEEDARIRQMEAELDKVLRPEKYHTYEVTIDNVAMNWQRYEADLAKEIALKVANKYSDPKEAAEYAVSVAKAVVENLKKK